MKRGKLTWRALLSFFIITIFTMAMASIGTAGEHPTGDHPKADHSKSEHPKAEKPESEQSMQQNISPCMDKMHNMIENMNKILKKDIKSDDRTKVAEIMSEMSRNLMDMSHMMKKGYCTIEELEKLNKDVSNTEKRFDEFDDYL
jgi:hypothetical protein